MGPAAIRAQIQADPNIILNDRELMARLRDLVPLTGELSSVYKANLPGEIRALQDSIGRLRRESEELKIEVDHWQENARMLLRPPRDETAAGAARDNAVQANQDAIGAYNDRTEAEDDVAFAIAEQASGSYAGAVDEQHKARERRHVERERRRRLRQNRRRDRTEPPEGAA